MYFILKFFTVRYSLSLDGSRACRGIEGRVLYTDTNLPRALRVLRGGKNNKI